MSERPTSVTLIGWWLIISQTDEINHLFWQIVAVDLTGVPANWTSARGLFELASSAFAVVCGCGILKGWPWSRVLFLARAVAAFVFSALFAEVGVVMRAALLIVEALLLALFGYFLFRPKANAWFAAKGLKHADASANDVVATCGGVGAEGPTT